jgi:hypothetical protein
MKTVYKVIILLLAAFMLIGCVGNNNTSDNTQSETQNEPAQVKEPAKTQETPTTPVVIATFEGESTKDTETFHVPSDQFKISWDTKPGNFEGNFIFTIKNADGSLKAAGANVIGTNSESTIVRGAGDYYLSITATQPYKITVETM